MINLRLLIVDDDPGVRACVAAALKDDPLFVLRACAAGREALAAAVEWRPDLILLDAQMPGMSGTTVLKRLRADRRTAPIPVVFMAAAPARVQRDARLIACGAAGVIDKPSIAEPCEPATLGATLRRFVAVEGVLSPARERFFAGSRPTPGRCRTVDAIWRRRAPSRCCCGSVRSRIRSPAPAASMALPASPATPPRCRTPLRASSPAAPDRAKSSAPWTVSWNASSRVSANPFASSSPPKSRPWGIRRGSSTLSNLLGCRQNGEGRRPKGEKSCSILPSERAPRRSTPRGSTG